ncbi:MAG: DNA-directed DNA polymerase II small subunit [Candidatus Woesearchaeota archaeon]
MIDEKSRRIIEEFVKRNVLVSPDAIEKIKDLDRNLIDELLKQNIAVLDSDIIELYKSNRKINIEEFERAKSMQQKFGEDKLYNSFFEKSEGRKEAKEINGYSVKIIKNYFENANKKTTENFVNYYLSRYKFLSSILENNIGLKELTTIRKVKEKRDNSEVSIIGIVYDKAITKTNKIQLVLEDQTGLINVFVTESNKELYEKAKDIVTDEVIGVLGTARGNFFFAKEIFLPEVPIVNEALKSEDEAYAVFLSDFHIGSNKFMPEELNKFLSWINSDLGDEKQRRTAELTKYIFIMGDLVDGVGIYPGQEKELTIKDIYKQYEAFVSIISKIPKDKHIIIIPGNHDAVRISEPQPPIPKKFIPNLYEMENITLLSNPSTINIHGSGNFPGFDVLLYHGFSFDYYVVNVNSIRLKGGYDRADLVIKFLLQRRHLAPSYTSTIFSPEYDEDPLVISRVPQIVATGHIHKCSISDYRGTTLISGSCWQLKTSFQEKMGHHPEPGRVPVINLKTRNYKILKFV